MQGFLWLLLQMSLLLLAAAGFFFWLGWRWRGAKAEDQRRELNQRVDEESAAAAAAKAEQRSAQAALELLTASRAREAAELEESAERQGTLERQILHLADELKAVSQRAEAAEAALVEQRAEVEKARLDEQQAKVKAAQVDEPRKDVAEARLAEQQKEVLEAGAGDEGAKAAEVALAGVGPEAANGHESTSVPVPDNALDGLIQIKREQVAALRVERDLCQKRLEEVSSAEPAERQALAAAKKGLTRAETKLKDAITGLERQQHCVTLLRRSTTNVGTGDEDDLTMIKGIKAGLNERLRAYGIRSYQQIAGWTEEEAEAVSELLGFKNRVQREQWRRQAKELHRAKHPEV